MQGFMRGFCTIRESFGGICLLAITFRVVRSVNQPADHGTTSRSSDSFNFQFGHTVIPQVFRHHNDTKWGSSRAEKAGNVIKQRSPTVKKFVNYSSSNNKLLDPSLGISENPNPQKGLNVSSVAFFENVNGKRNISWNSTESDQIYTVLRNYKIIPDVLYPHFTTMPLKHLQITYSTNIVKYGTELYSLQIENEPVVVFKGEKKTYYSLIAVGPDMSSYKSPDERNWLHWCVGNIPEGNVSRGRVVTPYEGLMHGYELGPHRIVFLLFKQPSRKRLKFKESEFSDKLDFFRRAFYNPYVFVERYNLTGPIAANFLIALWENEIHQAGSVFQ